MTKGFSEGILPQARKPKTDRALEERIERLEKENEELERRLSLLEKVSRDAKLRRLNLK